MDFFYFVFYNLGFNLDIKGKLDTQYSKKRILMLFKMQILFTTKPIQQKKYIKCNNQQLYWRLSQKFIIIKQVRMLKIHILNVHRMAALLIFMFRKVFFSNLVKQKENVEQKKDNIKYIVVDNVTQGNSCDFIIVYQLQKLLFYKMVFIFIYCYYDNLIQNHIYIHIL
ncbi:unnamed protein product [Paramecium primaurelia]|uniref:Uncharacterized protein n=1 Tax=Paramecium primaurelia TaxID=5886 RepID=A0A8S1PH38_PARPR|nr:unnamed protein product [Paramecium primaurelia]